MGDSALMECVFQSTEENLMTKVDWMFSPEEHTKVMRRSHLCRRSPWPRCQDSREEVESRHQVPCGGIERAWALGLVRTGPSPSFATWLSNLASSWEK